MSKIDLILTEGILPSPKFLVDIGLHYNLIFWGQACTLGNGETELGTMCPKTFLSFVCLLESFSNGRGGCDKEVSGSVALFIMFQKFIIFAMFQKFIMFVMFVGKFFKWVGWL